MPITFRCSSCAQVLKVADKLAGSRAKCPKCGSVLQIPVSEEPVLEAPARPPERAITKEQSLPPRRRAAEAAASDDGDDAPQEVEERPRPRKKKKQRQKSPALLYGLIGGGCFGLLLICSGVGALGWWYFSSAGIDDDLKYMPSNCQMIASVRIEQPMQSEVFKELQREVSDVDTQKANLSKEIGLSADDMDQVVVGGSANSKDSIIVVRTKKAVEARDLLNRIQNVKFTETKVGKYVLQQASADGHPSFCVVDKKRVVYGETDGLRAVLTRDKKPEFSKNLQAAIKQADFSKSLVFVADVQSSRSQANQTLGLFGQNNGMLRALEKINAVTIQVKLDSEVRYDMTLICQDAAGANDVKKVIDGVLVMGRNKKDLPKEVSDLLELNLKVDGSKVTGNNHFKVGPLIRLFKQSKGKR